MYTSKSELPSDELMGEKILQKKLNPIQMECKRQWQLQHKTYIKLPIYTKLLQAHAMVKQL